MAKALKVVQEARVTLGALGLKIEYMHPDWYIVLEVPGISMLILEEGEFNHYFEFVGAVRKDLFTEIKERVHYGEVRR